MVYLSERTFFSVCTMNGNSVILTSAYLAPIEYYTKLYAYDVAYIECFDHYMKQTYRNRCMIASAGGLQTLTIPTEKSKEAKCFMKDVRISDIGTLLIRPIGIVRFSIITRMNFMRSLLGNMNICMILTGTYVSGYANR